MRRIISFLLIAITIIAMMPLAMAANDAFPFEDFESAFFKTVVYEKGNNTTQSTAQNINNKETILGEFTFADTIDSDYYRIILDEKSDVLIYSSLEAGNNNLFLTLWDDDTLVLSSETVMADDGTYVQIMYGTLEKGKYDLWVSDPMLDGTNNVFYAVYVEAIPATKNNTKSLHGEIDNFRKTKIYEQGCFADVPSNEWYANYVQLAYELGLVNGIDYTHFNPNGDITIAETIALAARIHSIYHTGTADFEQSSIWFNVYVDYAIDNKIIEKNEFNNYFATATRAEFAGILARALPEKELEEFNTVKDGQIPDVSKNNAYADEIYMLYRAGILTGNDKKGTFGPGTSIQRSAVAAIVTRMAIPNERQAFYLR